MLTVIASMEYEMAGLRVVLGKARPPVIEGSEHGGSGITPPDLHITGVGRERSEASVQQLLDMRTLMEQEQLGGAGDGILLLGFSGAVDPSLRTGDLILSSRYYRDGSSGHEPQADSGLVEELGDRKPTQVITAQTIHQEDYFTPDQAMLKHAVKAARNSQQKVSYQDSLTVEYLVSSREKKQSIAREFPVGIVNMEDYWIASIARDAGVPFISARVVLDPAGQSLPKYLPSLAGSRLKATASLVVMPWRLPALLGLARQLPVAQRVLTRFALAYVRAHSTQTQPESTAELFPAELPNKDSELPLPSSDTATPSNSGTRRRMTSPGTRRSKTRPGARRLTGTRRLK